MSCFVAHSSSDSGSCGHSDITQRTACTVEHRKESILKNFIKKRSNPKIIVQYVKRNSQLIFSDSFREDPLLYQREDDKKHKRKLNLRKHCSSTGDLRLIENASNTTSPPPTHRKCLSCCEINLKESSI